MASSRNAECFDEQCRHPKAECPDGRASSRPEPFFRRREGSRAKTRESTASCDICPCAKGERSGPSSGGGSRVSSPRIEANCIVLKILQIRSFESRFCRHFMFSI